jgi:hypothetical protein
MEPRRTSHGCRGGRKRQHEAIRRGSGWSSRRPGGTLHSSRRGFVIFPGAGPRRFSILPPGPHSSDRDGGVTPARWRGSPQRLAVGRWAPIAGRFPPLGHPPDAGSGGVEAPPQYQQHGRGDARCREAAPDWPDPRRTGDCTRGRAHRPRPWWPRRGLGASWVSLRSDQRQ